MVKDNKAPIYGGKFGSVKWVVFNNRNKRNTLYRIIQFTQTMFIEGKFIDKKFNISAQSLGDLDLAVVAARKWLRDK